MTDAATALTCTITSTITSTVMSHDHEHGHEHRGGVRGFLRELFVPHTHDAADSVDDALEASAQGVRALKISLFVLLATTVLQLVVVFLSNSVALLADTVHNFADALTAVPLWIAFVLARRAASRRYPYGYGRAEDLAGLFIVGVVAAIGHRRGVAGDRPPAEPATRREPRMADGRRRHRLHRQRGGRDLPHPGRPTDRISRARRRRRARPHRRIHVPRRRHRSHRHRARIPARRPDHRPTDLGHDLRPPVGHRSAVSAADSWTASNPNCSTAPSMHSSTHPVSRVSEPCDCVGAATDSAATPS